MLREVFIVKNTSATEVELKDFALLIPSGETVDLSNYDKSVTSDELFNYIDNGTLVRIIDGEEISVDSSYDMTNKYYLNDEVYENVIFVSKTGSTYETINEALNSITDNDSNNRYLIKLAPYLYEEDVVMKPYVTIKGMSSYARIQGKITVDFTGSTSSTILNNVEIRNFNDVSVYCNTGGILILNDINVKTYYTTLTGQTIKSIFDIQDGSITIGGTSSLTLYNTNTGTSQVNIDTIYKLSGINDINFISFNTTHKIITYEQNNNVCCIYNDNNNADTNTIIKDSYLYFYLYNSVPNNTVIPAFHSGTTNKTSIESTDIRIDAPNDVSGGVDVISAYNTQSLSDSYINLSYNSFYWESEINDSNVYLAAATHSNDNVNIFNCSYNNSGDTPTIYTLDGDDGNINFIIYNQQGNQFTGGDITVSGNTYLKSGLNVSNYNNISPQEGDLWYEGSQLKFSDGSDIYNLFLSGSTDFEILEKLKQYSSYGISTGLISGGTLSINSLDNTKFDIDPFWGLFVDQYTDPLNPTITPVYFSGATSVTLDYLSTHFVTYIYIDSNLNIKQSVTELDGEIRRNNIVLGLIIHSNNTNIVATNSTPLLSPDVASNTYDLMNVVGLIKVDEGNRIYPINSNLNIGKTSGQIFKASSNYNNNIRNPNIKLIPEESPVTFAYRTFDGQVSGVTSTLIVDEYEIIDASGNSSVQTITGSRLQATVQRVYLFESGDISIQRGQAVYPTIEKAVSNFLNEDFQEEFNIMQNALLISCIATTIDCDDLSNESRSAFISIDRYGSIVGGSNTNFFEKDNIIIVKSLDDLPNPDINDVINLTDSFTYEINGIIDIENYTLDIGNNIVIKGSNPSNDRIIGNTSGTMFTGNAKSALFEFVSFISTNNSGQIFSLTGSTNSQLVINNCYILGNSNIGSIGNYNFVLLSTMYINSLREGLTLFGGDSQTGATSLFFNDLLIDYQITPGNTLFKVDDGYFSTIKLWDNNVRISSGNTFFSVNTGQTNVDMGTLRSGLFYGNVLVPENGSIILDGVSKSTKGWLFNNNRNIEDSIILGFIEIVNNTTETTINSSAIYYKAAGVNGGNTQGERTDVSTNNRITYVDSIKGTFTADFNLTGNITADGNNQAIAIAIFKNGTINIGETSVWIVRNNEPTSFSLNQVDEVNINDYYEIYVRNFTSTSNITIENLQFKIKGEA